MLLISRHVFFGINSVDGAFWNAHGAVNTLIGVDGQKVGAFAETVHGTDVHAIGVLALDTGFGDGMGHFVVFGVRGKPCILLGFHIPGIQIALAGVAISLWWVN
jgi:hypothetical protein